MFSVTFLATVRRPPRSRTEKRRPSEIALAPFSIGSQLPSSRPSGAKNEREVVLDTTAASPDMAHHWNATHRDSTETPRFSAIRAPPSKFYPLPQWVSFRIRHHGMNACPSFDLQ